MRRSEVEKQLRLLGWSPDGPSGKRHTAWSHPRRLGRIVVPDIDLMNDAVGEAIITAAGG